MSATQNEITSIKKRIDKLLGRKLKNNQVKSNDSSTINKMTLIKQRIDKLLHRKLKNKNVMSNDTPTIEDQNKENPNDYPTINEITSIKQRIDKLLNRMIESNNDNKNNSLTIEVQTEVVPTSSHLTVDQKVQKEEWKNYNSMTSDKIEEIRKAIGKSQNYSLTESALIRSLLNMLENHNREPIDQPTIEELILTRQISDILENYNVNHNESSNFEEITLIRELLFYFEKVWGFPNYSLNINEITLIRQLLNIIEISNEIPNKLTTINELFLIRKLLYMLKNYNREPIGEPTIEELILTKQISDILENYNVNHNESSNIEEITLIRELLFHFEKIWGIPNDSININEISLIRQLLNIIESSNEIPKRPTMIEIMTIEQILDKLQENRNNPNLEEVFPKDEKILELIWKYLSKKDKFNCTRVCKRFDKIIFDMHHLVVNSLSIVQDIPRFSRYYKTVTFYDVECYNSDLHMFIMLEHLAPRLTNLTLYHCHIDLISLCKILRALPLLQSLELKIMFIKSSKFDILMEDLPNLLQLRHLKMDMCYDYINTMLKIFGFASNIQSLSLLNLNIKISVLNTLLKILKNSLKSLTIHDCKLFSGSNYFDINSTPNDFSSFDCLHQLCELNLIDINKSMLEILNTKCINWLTDLKIVFNPYEPYTVVNSFLVNYFCVRDINYLQLSEYDAYVGPIITKSKSSISANIIKTFYHVFLYDFKNLPYPINYKWVPFPLIKEKSYWIGKGDEFTCLSIQVRDNVKNFKHIEEIIEYLYTLPILKKYYNQNLRLSSPCTKSSFFWKSPDPIDEPE